VEVHADIGPVNFAWTPDPIADYLIRIGMDQLGIDARCVNYKSSWSNGTDEPPRPEARNRLYDEYSKCRKFTFIGSPWVSSTIRGNDIARESTVPLFAHALENGLEPEDLLFAPGVYGAGYDARCKDFWCRPVTIHELRSRFGKFVIDLADSTRRVVSESPTGLFCLDRSRMHHLRAFARSMNRHRTIRYSNDSENFLIPCTYSDKVWKLVEFVRDLRIDEFRRRA
jgi:hypothetical protein